MDDKYVLIGMIFINRNGGLRLRDAPEAYGPHKTLYSRWKRWSERGTQGCCLNCQIRAAAQTRS